MTRPWKRRTFLKRSAVTPAVLTSAATTLFKRPKKDRLVGIQIAPHSLLDEGIKYVLDLLQEEAAINTLFLNVYGYYGGMGRSVKMMGDHGKPKKDASNRNFPMSWIRHDHKFFIPSGLFHPKASAEVEFGDIDILEACIPEVKARGMQLYVRMYEGFGTTRHQHIKHWAGKTNSTDVFGNDHHLPCFNKEAFRLWWVANVQNLCSHYDIDGIQYGSERGSILHHTIWRNTQPTCFCSTCHRRAMRTNIDLERAREGYLRLAKYIQQLAEEDYSPEDGVWVALLRILFDYPEILAWEKQDHLARDEMNLMMYEVAKTIKPQISFGAHISLASQAKSLIDRAQDDYQRMLPYSDFFKLIVYHEIGGVRHMRNTRRMHQTLLKEFELDQAHQIFMGAHGLDLSLQPDHRTIEEEGFHPEYVYKEISRCVSNIQGQVPVYAGIGFDIPKGKNWGDQRWNSDPAKIAEAINMAHKGGADGLVASREYEEMDLSSLQSFGRAVRSLPK